MIKNCGFTFDTTYTKLPKILFEYCVPAKRASPKICILNYNLANDLGLDFSFLDPAEQAQLFSGNMLPKGAKPFAQAYAGHQFGYFTILGDGRALVLGEHITPSGKRFDIQFKGSGSTPYSRRGDGEAVLGPMLREYLISEAMYYLGIPTTRSLAVVATGCSVIRETPLPGAILTRVASSHIRFGTFEFAAAKGGAELVEQLLNYTIKRHYPFLIEEKHKPLKLIEIVMKQQINLIINWMRVGFIHGVMNTDNMSISGETIDYGPCAFIDIYNPNTVFSSIDHGGRYAYANQPKIAHWNIARFAETLIDLIDDNKNKAVEILNELINQFPTLYYSKWLEMMSCKLGLSKPQAEDEKIILDLLKWMEKNHADYTNTFRDIMNQNKLEARIYQDRAFINWHNNWKKRLEIEGSSQQIQKLMQQNNPTIIPRNHKVEEALNAAYAGNFKLFYSLLEAVKSPYQENVKLKNYQSPPDPGERIYQTFCGT